MKCFATLAVLAAFYSCTCAAEEAKEAAAVDRTDAKATAVAALAAYKQKDLAKLADLCAEGNREIFAEIAEQGEKHGRYKSIFSGWRWNAVAAWDGTIKEVRYRGPKTAAAYFADGEGDEVIVVMLELVNGQWCFEDINSPDKESFEELIKTRE